jgi:hypothetical protein
MSTIFTFGFPIYLFIANFVNHTNHREAGAITGIGNWLAARRIEVRFLSGL